VPRRVTDPGFTIVELMVVVLILGILLSIAVVIYPTLTGNAEQKACFANERTVEGMWVGYLSSKGRPDPYPTDWADTVALLVPQYVQQEPFCPGGGAYTWDDDTLTCSLHGHF
jgi:prepilin-type N-terminal cleavage/methylation domain-containing protein